MVRVRLFLVLMAAALLAVPAGAQDMDSPTTRDPWALARRLLGFDAEYAIPDPTPLYRPGATAEFWVSKAGADTPTRILARLAAATGRIYLWVEDGRLYDARAMQDIAVELDRTFTTLRLRAVYGDPTIIPNIGRVPDPTSLLPLPDVDNDPHLFIVYAAELGDAPLIYNPQDSVPVEIAPGGYSNQHELLTVNLSALPDAPANNPAFTTLIIQGLYEYLAHQHTPDQDQWLKEALGVFVSRLLEAPQLRPNAAQNFMQNTNIPLLIPFSAINNGAIEGGQQLFLDYVVQRFGFPLVQNAFQQPGSALQPFDAALRAGDWIDPLTGGVPTGDQVFADFAVANIATYMVQQSFGDGRYIHQVAEVPTDTPPAAFVVQNAVNATYTDLGLAQYGTEYFVLAAAQPTRFTVTFTGQPETARLELPADADPANRFYWSGRGANQNTTLTRAFDLTGVQDAALTFDAWYDLPLGRSYAYITVSTDGGATWDILETDLSSAYNRYGLAYGPGYTGLSSYEGPRPFPVMGVLLGPDGITLSEITPDGPASRSDLQAGDVIIGYDGQTWPGVPDIIGLLANYDPGDTLNLYIQRGQQRLSVPVELGEHPTRVKLPDPVWVSQVVNLTPYVGQEILLRFEYISPPQGGGWGIAIDNIALPHIGYQDDAEGDGGWTLHGWQQIDNRVPQRFAVQAVLSGTETQPPRVRTLIAPGSADAQGEWRFSVQPQEIFALAISGLSGADTWQPGSFSLTFAPDTPGS
jgi:hypothetical protein